MSVRRTVAALAVAALLLAGCSDDPEPRFDPPSESPSPTESETTAEPEAQTPEEFIREWFELNTEMQNSGETDAFLEASPNCKPCRDLADQVEQFYNAGGFIRVGGQDVTTVDALAGSEYSVTVDAAPTEYKESASAKVAMLPGGPNEYRMFLRRNGGSWVMTQYLDTPS